MTTSDGLLQEAREWLEKVASGGLFHFRVDADPHPESLRVGARGKHGYVYPGKLYAEFLHECVKQLAVQRPIQPLDGDLVALVEVIVRRPEKTKKARPSGDFDNLAKGPSDALTQAGIWADDDNVVSAIIHKRWASAGEPPGVFIVVGRLP